MHDAKRIAPAAQRNRAAIVEVLGARLATATGHALEIGSGSGQHVLALARALRSLQWWPSDPDPAQRASIDAWRAESGTPNLRAALDLDAGSLDWGLGAIGAPPDELAVVWSANVVHISPWAVAEGLFAGAGRYLRCGGELLLYGPFSEGGRHHASSNARFDADLRARDPRWGVRDLDDLEALAREHGLALDARIAMPANNHVLAFRAEGEQIGRAGT